MSYRTRRTVGRGLPVLLLTALVSVLLLQGGCGSPSRPNVLLIILDTTRADALSCYESRAVPTPNVDAIAQSGVVFRNAYALNPYTLGSVGTILTSLGPAIHGLRANGGFRLAAEAVTLAEVFHDAGYTTAAFVSAVPLERENGLDQGFDLYDDDFSDEYAIYDPWFEPLRESLQGAERRGDVTTDRVLHWLEEDRPRAAPFFLVVHYFDPHQPHDPPPPFRQDYENFKYGGEIAFVDSQVGRLVQALADVGAAHNTVVALVADHGEAFKEHNETGHGFLLYDTTLRVPMMMTGPGIPVADVTGNVNLSDVAPTLLEAVGLTAPSSFEGRDLVAAIAEAGAGPNVHISDAPFYMDTYFARYYHRWSELLGWRSGPWKYTRGPHPELFRLDRDPKEERNVIEAEPEKTEEMSAALDAYLAGSAGRRLDAVSDAPDEETLSKLKSLGYVGSAEPSGEFAKAGWEIGLQDPKEAIIAWNARQEAKAYYRFSIATLDQGKYEESLKWAEKVLESDPNMVDALSVQGQVLNLLGRASEALDPLERYLAEKPDDAAAWFSHGLALQRLGRTADAVKSYERALQLNPDHPEANLNLGRILVGEQRHGDALPYFEKLRELEPKNVPRLVDLARVQTVLGRYAEAKEALLYALALEPTDGDALLLMGLIRLQEGDLTRARLRFEEFLEHHSYRPEASQVREQLDQIRQAQDAGEHQH